MMKQELHVTGMSCQNCVKHVEQAIQSLPGIKKATVDLKKEQARVTYDDTQLSNEAIKDQINEQTHYHATILKTKRSLF
ncbi:heavy-metal-associated domain-containing protein [uncultured Enterococcus sp.]|uniref:heavy-metal-associated domain-containing protein n=1 Tax=uncultured Enterococcus sp. TaxID=167972 RepID=UPI0025DC49C1|nr:heavy-metal-associated domain-containing protein [uncultured Enterococcus sp.]